MTNLTHLQNALNKVVNDVNYTTLEAFATYISTSDIDLKNKDPQELKDIVDEYLKSNTSNVFTFVPKKGEEVKTSK